MESLEQILQEHRSTQLDEAESETTLPEHPVISEDELRAHASALVTTWEATTPERERTSLPQRLEKLAARLEAVLLRERAHSTTRSELLKNRRMLKAVLASMKSDLKPFQLLPQIHIPQEGALPRILNLAEHYLSAAEGIWSPESLSHYVQQAQQHHRLLLDEVVRLPQVLKFTTLEYILDRAEQNPTTDPCPPGQPSPVANPINTLLRLNEYEWRPLIEACISFEPVLRQDPTGTYSTMDDETRDSYRRRVAHLARHADFNEFETAVAAIEMAREAQSPPRAAAKPIADPRLAHRTHHVGYYLFAEGLPALEHRIGYHAPLGERVLRLIRRYNEDVYIIGIMLVTLFLIIPIIAPLVPHNAFWLVMLCLLLALLPVTQGAVDLINSIVSSLLKAETLPKIDYTKSVPVEATTVVVVPTLLLRERQVQELFDDLEARYLANEDPNIHFALLTDLPDTSIQPTPDERDLLVQFAIRSTNALNAKYANGKGGAFLLLHRHRVFNSRQGVWMGWERKRGKLLDLNKLLLHTFDSFPIKAGPLHVLENARYIITLDSDTKLPHAAAARMIGTIAHPLNRAIIDPGLRIVKAGYGILQPRVGVSVASASRSRLAAIYSGETGFDIYTRAVSDVYQDLFGEGIFTGKGIYEVSILHQVLERRFPRNELLSHDLIEGAYVRAGLVTDVEIIDDYPSQYDAHNRRKHRWIRGDWQIMRWLFSPVPDESGRLVQNPISLISQWKIFDNLRRSLVEPVTFLVLVLGWFVFPGGARYWTVVTLILLLLPALVQLIFDLGKSLLNASLVAARVALSTFAGSIAVALLNLTFLAHQMMVSLDAIVRSLTRSLFSGKRLLEWETAAQAEIAAKRSSIDIYLQLSPVAAILIAAGLRLDPNNRGGLVGAGPVLVLWLIAPFVAMWLNSPPRATDAPLTATDRGFLEDQVLRIWRFYSDFSTPANHWLIPDNVEEKDLLQVRMLTPTNIGLLLNARQAAVEFGLLTLPEFAEATLGSLTSYARLEKHRGHIFNWYDLESLRPIPPVVVSTVDSGNLAASLYTLHAGAVDLLKRPMLNLDSSILPDATHSASHTEANHQWLAAESLNRQAAVASFTENYLPWLLPAYASLELPATVPTPESAEAHVHALTATLAITDNPLARELEARLPAALARLARLREDLATIAALAQRFVDEMDFAFLFNEPRQLLSNGYDTATHHLHKPCFDLLASEARMAAFLSVAKGDLPQQSWFRLDRSHVMVKGRAALLSWTATMFEYLMPTLWMRSYPDTLLSNSLDAVIRAQIDYARHTPWGISESGHADTDDNGRYLYHAWGIPTLALKYRGDSSPAAGPVISPYSTFLALPLLRKQALANLRRMAALGWVGDYGFYEAADYMQPTPNNEPRLVRSWMAHHQGMSLLALTNVLRDNIVQTWFHANPRIRATEQLLHEKPLSKSTLNELAAKKEPNGQQ